MWDVKGWTVSYDLLAFDDTKTANAGVIDESELGASVSYHSVSGSRNHRLRWMIRMGGTLSMKTCLVADVSVPFEESMERVSGMLMCRIASSMDCIESDCEGVRRRQTI